MNAALTEINTLQKSPRNTRDGIRGKMEKHRFGRKNKYGSSFKTNEIRIKEKHSYTMVSLLGRCGGRDRSWGLGFFSRLL